MNKPKVTTFKSRAKRIARQKKKDDKAEPKEPTKIKPATQEQQSWFENEFERMKNEMPWGEYYGY